MTCLSPPTDDGRGVSPVIGVILMVAVTVVLAAVIGTYVLDLGVAAGGDSPTASLSVSPDPAGDALTIVHRGGDALDASRTRVVLVNGSSGVRLTWAPTPASTLLTAGGAANLSVADADAGGGETIDWDGDGTSEYRDSGTGDVEGIRSGVEYTLWLIDARTDRVYLEATVRA